MTVAQVGIGGTQAAAETEKAISFFSAHIALFVGIAGGCKDVQLGEIVVATKIYAYESGKDGERFEPRPELRHPSHALEQRARHEALDEVWLKRLDGVELATTPRVHLGPLAAGAKVIASRQSDTAEHLRTTYGDVLAVEMEGHGFLQALHVNHAVHGLVICGIANRIDGKAEDEEDGRQEIAARHAAAFAFQVLAKFTLLHQGKDEVADASSLLKPHIQQAAYTSAQQRSMSPIEFYSCFISYSSHDQDIAKKLYADLRNRSVRCWFASHHMRIGDEIRIRIEESIRTSDKLLLILSKHSVASPWVETEVEIALEEERRRNKSVLFPIRIDEAAMRTTQSWAAEIRRTRHIGDFRRWRDSNSYQQAFMYLLRDLKVKRFLGDLKSKPSSQEISSCLPVLSQDLVNAFCLPKPSRAHGQMC